MENNIKLASKRKFDQKKKYIRTLEGIVGHKENEKKPNFRAFMSSSNLFLKSRKGKFLNCIHRFYKRTISDSLRDSPNSNIISVPELTHV